MCLEPRLQWSCDSIFTVDKSFIDPYTIRRYRLWPHLEPGSFRYAQGKAILILTGVFVGKRETLALTHRKYDVTVVVFGCGSQAKGLWPPLQAERRRGERFSPEV